uniref:Protein disulfide-isomerase n=1 Tax=Araucaria cunninghamii TaxID=56994 RepID=A0A0D6R5R2_ARACU
MARGKLVIFAFVLLLLACTFQRLHSAENAVKNEPDVDEIDEAELLEEEDDKFLKESTSAGEESDSEEDFGNYEGFDGLDGEDDGFGAAPVDEKDVLVLKEGNFSDFVSKNRFVMVEFYAPWCGHCQALAPEYAAAATELKGEIALAKVDATEESDLAEKYSVQGFPTIYFFADGVHKPYAGERTKEGIVSWIKRKTGPAVSNLTSTQDAETLVEPESAVAVALFDKLEGPASEEFAAAARLEDDVLFYQTTSESVAAVLNIDTKAKRPALVLLKKQPEKVSHFDGNFEKGAISEFIFANKLPLVTTFTRESASLIFESTIKRQIILFVNDKHHEKIMPTFQEAAKFFKGKIIFVHVDCDNEDVGKPIMEFFGITAEEPKVMAYKVSDESKKYLLEGEINLDSLKAFGEGFLEDKLNPFLKSDPVPEKNDDDVKIVVGKNFDEIVLDESKDVLLEIYAPWCGHCQALEPTYNKLAKQLRGVESLVIAKMDGTTNEHPRAKSDGFPTILFYPSGNKSFDPITVDTDRTVKALYKFLKKNASIPFKLPKKNKGESTESASISQDTIAADQSKDEL